MLEYPLPQPYAFDDLAHSLPSFHHPHHVDTKAPAAVVHHHDDPASHDVPDSPPSALSSSYSPNFSSYDHRPSPGSFSSVSPPGSAGLDGHQHPSAAVEDARFAYSLPSAGQSYLHDRRRSLPIPQHYRAQYNHYNNAQPSLSSSLPSSNAFPHERQPTHTHYSPRPSEGYAYPANAQSWDAPHAPSDEGPFTTAPVDGAAHELALTATTAALATSGVPVGHPYDEGAWIEPGGARPSTAGSASGALGHPYAESASAEDGLGDEGRDEAEGKAGQKGKSSKTYSFVALPGNAVKKRPRRRYDEIERLYRCSFPNCTKAYGTLNHLNAHVTMQKHGAKRSPGEFKELRKQWRMQKKEQEELSRDRARAAQLEHDHDESARHALEYGLPMPLHTQHLQSSHAMPAHGLVAVGLPIDSAMGATLQPMGVPLAGTVMSPSGLPAAFPGTGMGLPTGHALVGPGQSLGAAYPPPFARRTSSYEYPLQQSLHPHAQAQAQLDGARHHGERYDYERRASFDTAYARDKYDGGHRVGYADVQQQQQMSVVYRRRGSQPYPSPHSLTHSPHAQLAYPEDEYREGFEYRAERPAQSPAEEYYSGRRWEGQAQEGEEPLLTTGGHVALGSNTLPPNSTLLTPLPNFRPYEAQEERWEEEEERERRGA